MIPKAALLLRLLPALGCALAGCVLAWNHPLWPLAALVCFLGWVGCAVRYPMAWLFVVPALLPVLNFSPWTGWIVFEEFDLLLLGALAGGYGHLAWQAAEGAQVDSGKRWGAVGAIATAVLVLGVVSLGLGLADAGPFKLDWFASYTDPLNSVRVFKSLGFAALFLPLLRRPGPKVSASASTMFASGMVAGLTVLVLAVVWERAAFVGLMDFSTHYRTVGMFWEMHVGGAAIDSYLALSVPFVVWALITARSPVTWMGASALAILTTYACLTTFSRGVYLAVLGPLLLLALLLWRQKKQPEWTGPSVRKATWVLLTLLILEIFWVLGSGTFMADRISRTERDLNNRIAHWTKGASLLQTPRDWIWGIGLGRLPAHYARASPQGSFPGTVEQRVEQDKSGNANTYVTLRGPELRRRGGGSYGLTQRVTAQPLDHQIIGLDVRLTQNADLYVGICERHLLYDRECQDAVVHLIPGDGNWQRIAVTLRGAPLDDSMHRLQMLSVVVLSPHGVVGVDNISYIDGRQVIPLRNGDFSSGLASWFPAAQSYFVPWHIDNVYLEVLIERGLLSVVLSALGIGMVLWRLAIGSSQYHAMSPYWVASISGVLVVGLVSSVLDVPRVAFLAMLALLLANREERFSA